MFEVFLFVLKKKNKRIDTLVQKCNSKISHFSTLFSWRGCCKQPSKRHHSTGFALVAKPVKRGKVVKQREILVKENEGLISKFGVESATEGQNE